MTSLAAPQSGLLRQYFVLTKPRVTQLAVFCAVIGMFLAVPGVPDMRRVLFGTLGIWLLAAAAFAINCLMSRKSTPACCARRGAPPRAAPFPRSRC